MRVSISSLVIIGLSVLLAGAGNFKLNAHEGKKKIRGGEKFQNQLEEITRSYLQIRNALVKDNADLARENAKDLSEKLAGVDAKRLAPAEKEDWLKQSQLLITATRKIAKSSDVQTQRTAFADLSIAMIATVKNYGPLETTLYQQHCPMANGSRGADWLSDSQNIANPYLGQSMPTCGITKEVYGAVK